MKSSVLLFCYMLAYLLGEDVDSKKFDMPLFPESFTTTMTLSNTQLMYRFYCTFAIDRESEMIAMKLHYPIPGVESPQHIYALIDFKNGFISRVDTTNDLCETETLAHSSSLWISVAQFNPWLHLYGMKIEEKRMPTQNEIKLFLQDTTTLFDGQNVTVGGLEGTKWTFNFKLSILDNTYLRNEQNVTLDLIWSRKGAWHTGWGWGGGQGYMNETFPLFTELDIQPSHAKAPYKIFINYAFITPNTLDKEIFQIPSHVFCTSEKQAKIPDWGMFYSFEAEVAISPQLTLSDQKIKNGYIFYAKDYFDVQHGLSLSIYEHVDITVSNSTSLAFTEINDYNTNMLYTWSHESQTCKIEPSLTGDVLVDDVWDIARYHLWHDRDFFNRNMTYFYGKQDVTRGVNTNIVLHEREDWPPFLVSDPSYQYNVTSLWEWSISKDNWIADEILDTERRIPLKLDLTIHVVEKNDPSNTRNGMISYNLFNFHPKQLYMGTVFDTVQKCSNPEKNKKFILKVSDFCGKKLTYLTGIDLIQFMNDMHVKIVKMAGLETNLRIQIESIASKNGNDIVFSLFEGWNSSASLAKALASQDAIANLTASIVQQRFSIPSLDHDSTCLVEEMITDGGDADPKHSHKMNTGYSGGVLATVSIFMLLGGIIFGVIGLLGWSNRGQIGCCLSRTDDLVSLVR